MLRRFGLATFVLLLGLTAQGQDPAKIEWKFKEGDKFYLETTTSQKQHVEINGMKQPATDVVNTTVTSFKVIKADAAETVLEQKVESSKLKVNGAPGPEDKSIGTVLTITLNAKGEVTKIDGLDAVVKKLAKTAAEGELVKTALKQTVQDTFAFVPGKAVSKGDTWKRKASLPLGPVGSLQLDQEYTYTGPAKDGEHITVKNTSTYQLPKADPAAPIKITKGDVKSEEAKGTLVFDGTAGRLVRSDFKAKLAGKLTLQAMGKDNQMDMHQDTSITIKVMDKWGKDK